MSKLTQRRLKEALHYDSNTGVWVKNIKKYDSRGRRNISYGQIAGYKNSDGYIRINIAGKLYYAHRLAWLYVNGYFPENQIDHINRNPSDNRFDNLREVSIKCNARNCGNHKHNTSGVKGVCWYQQRNKWIAYIMVDQKKKHMGYYKSFTNAVCARLAGEQCLDWEGCDSNSPAYQYVQKMLRDFA